MFSNELAAGSYQGRKDSPQDDNPDIVPCRLWHLYFFSSTANVNFENPAALAASITLTSLSQGRIINDEKS